jgi:hypothetical protein
MKSTQRRKDAETQKNTKSFCVSASLRLCVTIYLLAAAGCGGSSSETPWPAEPEGPALGPAGESAPANTPEDTPEAAPPAPPAEEGAPAQPQR